MFNKQSILENKGFDFLKMKLSDTFSIPDDDRSKVIFGYNGIGKTSIFRYIKEYKDDSRLVFLDYIDERDTFIKNKKKVTISANVNRINDLESEITRLREEMNIKNTVKSVYGVTNGTVALEYGTKMVSAQKDNFTGFTLSKEEMQDINNLITGTSSKFIVSNRTILQDARDIEVELLDYKSSFIYKALVPLSEIVTQDDIVCPICDSGVTNIQEIITQKLQSLTNVRSIIIEEMKKSQIIVTSENLDNLIEAIGVLDSNEKITDWMICDGDVQQYDNILLKNTDILQKEAELGTLQVQRDLLYNSLKSNELLIKSDIERYFNIPANKVKFSNSKKEMSISFDREVKTYSTGELNFLSFLVRIYEFIGSDKTILILDDPVSSFDIINHYKIVYELVKATTTEKMIIVLTHSVELLNTINSQFGDNFDYYYIDEVSNELIIQVIERVNTGKNVLALDRLEAVDNLNIVKALIEKENSCFNDPIHKLFHYDGSSTHPNYQFSNDDLVMNIESHTGTANIDFITNSYNKVMLIVSLRVWVEKKLRDLILNNQGLLDQYDLERTITNKINLLFPRNGNDLLQKPTNFSRGKIISKKVMLNQGVHYQSQVMPFAYAMNISIDDLNREIIEIKELFL